MRERPCAPRPGRSRQRGAARGEPRRREHERRAVGGAVEARRARGARAPRAPARALRPGSRAPLGARAPRRGSACPARRSRRRRPCSGASCRSPRCRRRAARRRSTSATAAGRAAAASRGSRRRSRRGRRPRRAAGAAAGSKSGIVDPHGLVQPERHAVRASGGSAARARAARRGGRAARRSRARPVLRRVVDRDPADVHRRGRALDREEGRVERRQALGAHGASPSSGCQWSCVEPRALGRVAELGQQRGEAVGIVVVGHVAGAVEDLEAAARHRRVRGGAVLDGDDRVALAPHDQRRQPRGEREPARSRSRAGRRARSRRAPCAGTPGASPRCRATRSRARAPRRRRRLAGRRGRAARRPRGRARRSRREVSAGST